MKNAKLTLKQLAVLTAAGVVPPEAMESLRRAVSQDEQLASVIRDRTIPDLTGDDARSILRQNGASDAARAEALERAVLLLAEALTNEMTGGANLAWRLRNERGARVELEQANAGLANDVDNLRAQLSVMRDDVDALASERDTLEIERDTIARLYQNQRQQWGAELAAAQAERDGLALLLRTVTSAVQSHQGRQSQMRAASWPVPASERGSWDASADYAGAPSSAAEAMTIVIVDDGPTLAPVR
jgi:hypothetical protein